MKKDGMADGKRRQTSTILTLAKNRRKKGIKIPATLAIYYIETEAAPGIIPCDVYGMRIKWGLFR